MSNTTAFACPSCGYSYTKALNTNKARSGIEVRRSRVCVQCKVQCITYEIRATDYAFLQAARKWLREDKLDTIDWGLMQDLQTKEK